MVKDDVKAQNTEEVKKGFTFRELDESVKEKELKVLKRKRRFKLLWMFILLFLGITMASINLNDTLDLFIYIAEITVAFVFFEYTWQDTSDIRDLKKGNMYEFDVEIVTILPVEVSSVPSVDFTSTTERDYPIIGRDVISGYEDKCYITEKVYREAKCGDVITLRRKFSKKDLRKRNITIQSKS